MVFSLTSYTQYYVFLSLEVLMIQDFAGFCFVFCSYYCSLQITILISEDQQNRGPLEIMALNGL